MKAKALGAVVMVAFAWAGKMKKDRKLALLMLLGFTLSACGPLEKRITDYTHRNRLGREFRVSVPACDEKNSQAYREVLKEMGYNIYHQWLIPGPDYTRGSGQRVFLGWRIDVAKDDLDEDLAIGCDYYEPQKEREIYIYSTSKYFPEEPKNFKENIHQKVLKRLKNKISEPQKLVPSK